MPTPDSPRARLLAVSFLALFLELAFIRFSNSTVQVVAYFNNFLILSAFLGLGLGSYMVRPGRDFFRFLPLGLPLLVLILVWLERYGFVGSQDEVVFWERGAEKTLPAVPVMFLVFAANCAFFVPIGYELGATLARFSNRLEGYAWDLLGSLCGVAAFALVAFSGSQPWTWFALSALIALWLLRHAPPWRLAGSAALLVAGVGLATLPAPGNWSPYYKIDFEPYQYDGASPGFAVLVDKLRIQDGITMDPVLEDTPLAAWLPYYRMPYRFRVPESVLVLGGGSGNDASMALRSGAQRVDVVEIDPVLVTAGRLLHPDHPYLDPRVRVVNDDARAFLRRAAGSYDLVVMNALDSHHQLPGLSTLRLESYIYTVEAFRDVRRRMAADALFIVHLSSSRPWMGQRLYASLQEAFGSAPRLFHTEGSPFGSVAFVFGPEAVLDAVGDEVVELDPQAAAVLAAGSRLATDDWPHLYLATNDIPAVYVQSLGLIVLLAGVLLFRSVRRLGNAGNLHLFLLGAGFMLLETRSITQCALLFGSTWIVNAVVIGAILLVVSLGNLLLLARIRVPLAACYIGLVASLVVGFLVRPDFILEHGLALRLVLTTVWFGLPVFFASLVFSHAFRDVDDPAGAFGANLLGVVVGGALEYASMVWGLNALYLLALGLYLLAAASDRALRDTPGAVVPVPA